MAHGCQLDDYTSNAQTLLSLDRSTAVIDRNMRHREFYSVLIILPNPAATRLVPEGTRFVIRILTADVIDIVRYPHVDPPFSSCSETWIALPVFLPGLLPTGTAERLAESAESRFQMFKRCVDYYALNAAGHA